MNHDKIYQCGLEGNLIDAVKLINAYDERALKPQDRAFVQEFKSRFCHQYDQSNFSAQNKSGIEDLLRIYRHYWRSSLISQENVDDTFVTELYQFFLAQNVSLAKTDEGLDRALTAYLSLHGYHSTGFGKTGRLYDLLAWKTQETVPYHIQNAIHDVHINVVFMADFVSLGWAEYATLGKYYASGWAAVATLYCVKHKYDVHGEKFLVSFLAHEAQHVEDYRRYHDLDSETLEYRAKLAELAIAKDTINDMLDFFIKNSRKNSRDGHTRANYLVISNMTKFILGDEHDASFNDVANEKLKSVAPTVINDAASHLLKASNQKLNSRES